MKKFIFETSKGFCFGFYGTKSNKITEVNNIHLTEKSLDIIDSLYQTDRYSNPFCLEEHWLKILLDDSFYGFPEYKIEWVDDMTAKIIDGFNFSSFKENNISKLITSSKYYETLLYYMDADKTTVTELIQMYPLAVRFKLELDETIDGFKWVYS